MTKSKIFNLSSDRLQVIVLSKSKIDKEEIDSENDLKDLVLSKVKGIKKYKEIFSDWGLDSKFYVMVIET